MFKKLKEIQEEIKKTQKKFSKLTKEKKESFLQEISRIQNNLQKSRQKLFEDLKDRRITIDKKLTKTHKKLKVGLIRSFFNAKVRHLLSAPFIYSMIIPIVIVDIWIEIYHNVCFRLYRIPLVKRKDYIVIDRHKLAYLNIVQKMNCIYCGYANGLAAYTKEIFGRTEKYWCPLKHSRELPDPHNHYNDFFEHTDGEGYVNRKKAE